MTAPIPVRLEAALLKTTMPDLVLREGMVMAARVIERNGNRGVLSMAGRQIAAELPETLAAGAEVRLRVQEAGADRVVLRVEPQQAAQITAQQQQAAVAAVPLPDGSMARLTVQPDAEHEQAAGGGGRATGITVTWQSAALGRMALRLIVEPTATHAFVDAEPRAAETVRAGADDLRDQLASATNRPAVVKVNERRDPVDFYV